MVSITYKTIPHQPRDERWRGANGATISGTTSGGGATSGGGVVVDTSMLEQRIAQLESRITELQNAYISKVNPDTAAGPITVNEALTATSFETPLFTDGRGAQLAPARLRLASNDSGVIAEYAFATETGNFVIDPTPRETEVLTKTWAVPATGYLTFNVSAVPAEGDIISVNVSVTDDNGASLPVSIDASGSYEVLVTAGDEVTITMEAVYSFNPGVERSSSMALSIYGTGNEKATIIPTTGGDQYSDVRASGIIVMSDQDGIKIDATGIYVTDDGGSTWTPW